MVGKKVKRAEFIEKYSILDDLKYDIFLLEPTHEMYLNQVEGGGVVVQPPS